MAFTNPPNVDDLLKALNIDRENIQFILADGHYIELEKWNQPIRSDNVQLWPRIIGG